MSSAERINSSVAPCLPCTVPSSCRAHLSTKGAIAGIRIASATTTLHTEGATDVSHPNSNSSREVTGTRLRRRLSRMRQRLIALREFGIDPLEPGTRENNHGAICQSPRIQRCWRLLR